MPWIDEQKAFPDLYCICLTNKRPSGFLVVPSKCSVCGADRTKDNWKD